MSAQAMCPHCQADTLRKLRKEILFKQVEGIFVILRSRQAL